MIVARVVLTSALFLCMNIISSHAAVYGYIKNGVQYYTDQPSVSAKRLVLPPVSSFSKLQNPSQTIVENRASKDWLNIINPKNESTIWGHEVSLKWQSSPISENKVHVYLDGALVQTVTTSPIKLSAINRGQHSIQLKLINLANVVVAASKVIIFYVHQPHIH